MKNLDEYIGKYAHEIDQYIGRFFSEKIRFADSPFISDFYSLLNEYCLRTGKRIRPLLLIISYLGYTEARMGLREIIRIASTLEIMHSFLLVQDDIIDKSPSRRGKKSLHVLCHEMNSGRTANRNVGNDVALILGDILFANVLEIIGKSGISSGQKSDFIRLLSKMLEITAWGQILDIQHSLPARMNFDEEIPLQISRFKTAYYTITGPMLMGYMLSGKKIKGEENRIRSFSLPLGLAFQVRDDIIGIFGRSEETGKSSDSDIAEGKVTVLIQHTVKNMRGGELERFISIFAKEKKSKSEIRYIRSKIEKSGALGYASGMLTELAGKANRHLRSLRIDDRHKSVLVGLVERIVPKD